MDIKRLLLFGSTFVTLTACVSSPTINSFKKFAAAGVAYETALDETVDAAVTANIDSNSLTLLNARQLLQPLSDDELETLNDEILAQNGSVIGTTQSFLLLKEQNRLLADYFDALGALAGYNGTAELTTSAKGAISSLQALSPSLENAKIGEAAPADLLGAAVPLLVANFQSKALSDELRANASIIDRQLEIQALQFEEVARALETDRSNIINSKLNTLVNAPYATGVAIPAGWIDQRRTLLLSNANTSDAALNAGRLSKKVRVAFRALVEGRSSPEDLALASNDIGATADLIAQLLNGSADSGARQ